MNNFLISMAWRNLWRQKRRTTLTMMAIALGIACLVFFTSLMMGFNQRLILLGTQTMKGEGQIHLKDYATTHESSLLIENAAQLTQKIRQWPGVIAIAPRLLNPALAAMGDRAVAVEMLGIDPETEPGVSNWKDRLWKGTYLEHPGQVMLGKKLAEKLELDVGGKLVLTSAEIQNGELNSQLLKVCGIIWSQNPQLNQSIAVVTLDDAWVLTGTSDSVHEIAMKFGTPVKQVRDIHTLLDPLLPKGVELLNWQEMLPEITFLLRFQDFFMGFAFVIIVFLVALGMMNTMGMAIIERIREFGVLQALGTLPAVMVKMVLFEFILMGIAGAAIGLLLGWAITLGLGITGIPVDQVEVTGFLLSDPIYPMMDWLRSSIYTALFCVMIPLFSIVPVRRITRLDTVRALRFS